MCGIAGYFVTKPERVLAPTLQKLSVALLQLIEQRGRDSTGYAYVSTKDSCVYLVKAPVKAEDFLKIPGHLLTKPAVKHMPRAMVLHTRAATQGSPSNNQNNHPIYSKPSGLCMVHNGWVHNDPELEEEHKLKRDAEVDTEIYLKLIEKYYLENINGTMESHIKAATKQVYGSIACAMIQGGRTHEMWVWRDAGALSFAVMDWGWVWASTPSAVMGATLFASSSFDGSVQELIEPPAGTLYTLGKQRLRATTVKGASWETLPKNLESGVLRTWANGKLTNVRRGRGNVRTYSNGQWNDMYGEVDGDWEGEYVGARGHYTSGGYHVPGPYEHGANGNTTPAGHYQRVTEIYNSRGSEDAHAAQPQLPAVVEPRARSAFGDAQIIPDQEGGESNPFKVMSRAQAESIAKVWSGVGYLNNSSCACRENYICIECGKLRRYYRQPYDALPQAQEAQGE